MARHSAMHGWAGMLVALAMLVGCGRDAPASVSPDQADFVIVSGSENKVLEPLVLDFCARERITCAMTYKGSLDIGIGLQQDSLAADAVWPAASIWVDMYDSARRVKHLTSIYQTPVGLGVRTPLAERFGWTKQTPSMQDVLARVKSRELNFLMTSATQSNSGAAAYLQMLTAASGSGDQLEAQALATDQVKSGVKALLAGVSRSSGSSGWLAELFLKAEDEGTPYPAMWNYEAVLKETNDQLRAKGKDLLYVVYPDNLSVMADSPLGFVDRGRNREAFFLKLQAHLLDKQAQTVIAGSGRRVALGRAEQAKAEPDWGFDPSRLVTAVALPEPSVISAALGLYQEALRKPSLTAMCLDYSGSMSEADGEAQLEQALSLILDPVRAGELLVQYAQQDVVILIPFAGRLRADPVTFEANAQAQAGGLASITQLSPSGGTDMYRCGLAALEAMAPYLQKDDRLPAIIMMTDGKSETDRAEDFERAWKQTGRDIPVFGVTFGDADSDQLEALSSMTRGRVFNGTKNLTEAFRSARGYN